MEREDYSKGSVETYSIEEEYESMDHIINKAFIGNFEAAGYFRRYFINQDTVTQQRIINMLRDIAQRDAVFESTKDILREDRHGIAPIIFNDTLLSQENRKMLAHVITHQKWRYAPLLLATDIEDLLDDLFQEQCDGQVSCAREVRDHVEAVQWPGIECGTFPYDWDSFAFPDSVPNKISFPSSFYTQRWQVIHDSAQKAFLMDLEKEACSIDVAEHIHFFDESRNASLVDWRNMDMGACSHMDRWFHKIFDTTSKYYGRGLVFVYDGVPLGIMKFKGNPSFLAMRTVRDRSDNILLVRGMTYVIAKDTIDGAVDDQFGRFIKAGISIHNGEVFPAVDLCYKKDLPVAQHFFKPLRFVRDATVYRAMHDFVRREYAVIPRANVLFSY